MKYKATTIAPAGRNKYGNYMSKGNVTKSVVMTTYAGNDTTTTIGGGNKDEDTGTTTFYAMFSITNISFSALDLIDNATAETQVIAYQGYDKAVTLVCDMNAVSATLRTDGSIESLQVPSYSGITGIPNGMQIAIENNGTNNAKIQVSANNTIPDNGIMNIPVCVYKRADDIPIADLYNWYDHAYQRDENNVYYSTNNCEVVWLELAWNVNRAATSNYQMDLSNERAGVNVSATTSQGDVLYPNSIASLVCTASTHMNGELVTGITYRISQLSLTNFNARGVAIVNEDNVGKLVFTTAGTNTFNFTGPTLPLDIVAALDGEDIATKTMTIDKNYPSADGQAAVTKWIVSDHDVIHYNPNTGDINPMVINAWVMRQVGDYEPIKDSATTIYYSYNGATPTQTLPFNNDYIVSAKTYYTGNTGNIPVSALTFALKNNGGVVYESEEIPCMWDGLNGTDGASGATGASGKNGTDGVDGQSAWYLTLDNDNASVNANASGRIYDQAIKPACHARLYYGSQPINTAKYKVDWGTASGITSAVSSNGVLTIDTNHSGFNFTDDILSISVSGYSGSTSTEVRDVKIMNITKSKAGAAGTNGETPYISGGTWWIGGVDTGINAEGENGCTPEIIDGYWWICGVNTGVKAEGTDAVSYWLSLDYTSVIFNRNDSGFSPSSITASAYRQVGEDPFTPSPDTYITIKYRKRSSGTWTGTTSSNTASITAKKCVDNDRIRFTLYKGTSQLDQEDVDILCDGMDGKNGENGAQGRQGPAIRGPFDYYAVSSSTQCWCAGESGSSCEECDRWIDIVLKDGKFYMCNKTYTGKCATNYASGIGNTTYWVESDSFDFVATRVLLASAASINFLTNNWLYLKDEEGNIVGGARGTSVDSGITFWSGAEDPEDASFKVDYEGNLYAKQGTFAGFVQYPYKFIDSTLMANLQVSSSTISARYLSDTNWQGRLKEAPKDPVSGMCYANTTEHKIYIYTNRWVQVYFDNDVYNGFLADKHAYLLGDNMMGTYSYSGSAAAYSQHLILPEPSEELNGFTYDIVLYPDYATRVPTRGSEQIAILSLITKNLSAKFYVAAFAADDDVAATLWKRIEFYAGHVQITCMPKRTDVGGSVVTEYIWVLTMCTAGMTTYDNEDVKEVKGAYGPIFGYSPNDNYLVPVKLQTDDNPNSNSRMRNTIYITL